MSGPIIDKFNLWRDANKGIKTRFNSGKRKPAVKREDVSDLKIDLKIERGSRLQEARLKRYPSIDVDYDSLFAGKIQGDLSDAKDRLTSIGFRNNPTAYVEITEEHGPDEGSYSRQFITEGSRRFDLPRIGSQPSLFHREKRQLHVTVYEVDESEVHFLAHEERSAWLQPMRHVAVNDSSARIGVRDFRDAWYDEFGEPLGGVSNVQWETSH